jgi:hypothetical protein
VSETPSSPGDGLEDALRRALSDAVSEVEPGAGGFDRIRARIGRRPPRPWLIAVLAGAAERARSWTWRGHWAWPGLPPVRAHPPWLTRRPRQRNGVPAGEAGRRGDTSLRQGALDRRPIGWLWLAAALAGVTVIASVSLGLQPVRQAIIQASTTVLHGGPDPQRSGGADTDGAGARTTTDGTSPASGGGATASGARPGPTGPSGPMSGAGAAPSGPPSTGACQPPASGGPEPTRTDPGTTSSASVATPPPADQAPGPADSSTSAPGTATWGTGAPGRGTPGTGTPDTGTPDTGTPDTGTWGTGASGTATPGTTTAGPTATPDQPPTPAPACSLTPGPATTTPATSPADSSASSTPSGTTPTDAPTPAGTPTGTEAAQDPAAGPTSAGQDDSPATPAAPGQWRWYDKEHRDRR